MRFRWGASASACTSGEGRTRMLGGADVETPPPPANPAAPAGGQNGAAAPQKPACFIGPGAPAPLRPRPGVMARFPRPNTWDFKTRRDAWDALRSRWRFIEGLSFWVGPPAHLLSRVWPPMLLNLAVFLLVSADHIVEAVTSRHNRAVEAAAIAAGLPPPPPHLTAVGRMGGILPPLSPSVAASLDPVFRLSLFAVSLLLTLRLGRVVDRWWTARRAFSTMGSLALAVAQRVAAGPGPSASTFCAVSGVGGGGGKAAGAATPASPPTLAARRAAADALASDAARWAAVWQASLLQLVTDSLTLHPAGAALLTPAERALYAKAPKGRQLASLRLTQLLLGPAGDGAAAGGPVTAAALLDRGAIAAGELSSIFLQSLPSAVTTMSTGATEAFLLLYPLSALTRGGGGGGGGAGASSSAAHAAGGSMGEGGVNIMAVPPTGHDASLASVLFTLLVQGALYAFVSFLYLGLASIAADLENPFVHLPLDNIFRSTVRDVGRALKDGRTLRRRLDGGGEEEVEEEDGVGSDGGSPFDWGPAVRLAAKKPGE